MDCGRPARRDQSLRRGASGIDFGGETVRSDWGCDESRASVLFLTVGASLISCLLSCAHNRRTAVVELLGAALRAPGQLLPMTGLYLGGPLVLLALSLRFHFLLLRLWEAWRRSGGFSDGQTLERDGPWYLMAWCGGISGAGR